MACDREGCESIVRSILFILLVVVGSVSFSWLGLPFTILWA